MYTRAFALVLVLLGQAAYSADIPVKQIILYKHGIGYFERGGSIAAGEQIRFDFKAGDMNDVLKSLTVMDSNGSRVTSVRYDSNETLQQQLERYPFQIGNQELLSAFLDRIKGTRIELTLQGEPVRGAILSSRAITAGPDNDKRVIREQVTLLLDSGEIANYDLASPASIQVLEPRLKDQLKQYLQTLAQAKSREKRSIYIDAPSSGVRNLHVAYIAPTPIWKSSYRLALGTTNATLEGWAIVDNTTDEDWNDVKLSVVSGRPISFISLLDTPRYGQRQIAELPEDRAAGPVVYGGTVTSETGVLGGVVAGVGAASGNGGGVGGGMYRTGKVANFLAPTASVQQSVTVNAEMSTVEGATGATLGELFEYNFGRLVTIKKNQSAMLPFLQNKITARKLLIYSDQDNEHPVNAVEMTNDSGKTLDGGPITVYDCGAYAGEALFETVKSGDKRLIGYAVDYGTRITSAYDTGEQTIREIHAKNGVLQLRYAQHETRTYTVRNVDSKAKTLVIEQPVVNAYSVLSPRPTERTASANRFEVKLPPSETRQLRVEQDHVTFNATAVQSSTPDFLLTLVGSKQLTVEGRRELQTLADIKQRIVQTTARLDATRAEVADLNSDQNRLRQNIDSLNRVRGQEDQVRRYSVQLAENETQLAKLRDLTREISMRKASLERNMRDLIPQLDF